MSKLLLPSDSFREELRKKIIWADTSLIIRYWVGDNAAKELFQILFEIECGLMTIDLCKFELIKGSNKAEEIDLKEKMLKELGILAIAPHGLYSDSLFRRTILAYKSLGARASVTDLMLAAATVGFSQAGKHEALILTENLRDFPSNLFTPKVILHIQKNIHEQPSLIGFLSPEKNKIELLSRKL